MRISLGKSSGKRPWTTAAADDADNYSSSTTSKASSSISTKPSRIFDAPEERRDSNIQYIGSIGDEPREPKDSPKASRPTSPYDALRPSNYLNNKIPEDQYGLIIVTPKEKTKIEPKRPYLLAHRLQKDTTMKQRSEEELLTADLAGKPAAPTLQDYERVPISGYGQTLLRSMGWDGKPSDVYKKTTPTGMFKSSGETKPISKSRTGLGKRLAAEGGGGGGNSLETGTSVLIINGSRHCGLRGKVVDMGQTSRRRRILVQLDLSGAIVAVHRDFLTLRPSTTYPIPVSPRSTAVSGVEGYPVGARVRIVSTSLLEGRLYWRVGTVVSLVGGSAGRVQIDKLEGHMDSDAVVSVRLEELSPVIGGGFDEEEQEEEEGPTRIAPPPGTVLTVLGGRHLGRIGRVVEASSGADSLTVHLIDDTDHAHESENGNLLFISISRHQVASYRQLYR